MMLRHLADGLRCGCYHASPTDSLLFPHDLLISLPSPPSYSHNTHSCYELSEGQNSYIVARRHSLSDSRATASLSLSFFHLILLILVSRLLLLLLSVHRACVCVCAEASGVDILLPSHVAGSTSSLHISTR